MVGLIDSTCKWPPLFWKMQRFEYLPYKWMRAYFFVIFYWSLKFDDQINLDASQISNFSIWFEKIVFKFNWIITDFCNLIKLFKWRPFGKWKNHYYARLQGSIAFFQSESWQISLWSILSGFEKIGVFVNLRFELSFLFLMMSMIWPDFAIEQNHFAPLGRFSRRSCSHYE